MRKNIQGTKPKANGGNTVRRRVNASIPKGRQSAGQPLHLSTCALNYARALANPFTGPLACVPSFPALLTRKMKCYAKGVLQTSNTTGVGFIYCDPSSFVASDSANNSYSSATYTGTTFSLVGVGTNLFVSNSEYVQAQFGLSALLNQYRVVSFGIRIRYVGTELDRGGQIIGFCDPNHIALTGRNVADLDGEIESKRFPVDRNWITVLYRPVFAQDTDFSYSMVPLGNATNYIGFILVAASATTPLSFEFEVYGNFEIVGRNVRGKTPSEVDFAGYGAVNTATVTTTHLQPNNRSAIDNEKAMVVYSNQALTSSTSAPPPTESFWGSVGSWLEKQVPKVVEWGLTELATAL